MNRGRLEEGKEDEREKGRRKREGKRTEGREVGVKWREYGRKVKKSDQ